MMRLLLLLLLSSSIANAAITRVQTAVGSVGTAGASTFSVTFGSNCTPGNTVVIVMGTRGVLDWGMTLGGQTTSLGFGANGPAAAYNATLGSAVLCYFIPVRSGATNVITFATKSAAAQTAAAVAVEYTGKLYPDINGPGNTGSATSTSGAGSVTPNYDNELLVGVVAARGTFSSAQTAFFTTPVTFSIANQTSTNINTTNNDVAICFLENIVSAIGTYTFGVTMAASSQYSANTFTFREIPATGFTTGQ